MPTALVFRPSVLPCIASRIEPAAAPTDQTVGDTWDAKGASKAASRVVKVIQSVRLRWMTTSSSRKPQATSRQPPAARLEPPAPAPRCPPVDLHREQRRHNTKRADRGPCLLCQRGEMRLLRPRLDPGGLAVAGRFSQPASQPASPAQPPAAPVPRPVPAPGSSPSLLVAFAAPPAVARPRPPSHLTAAAPPARLNKL